MRDEGSRLLSRRALCSAMVVGALSVSCWAHAQDAAGALRDLGESPDFRVRVSAALFLGRARPAGARQVLERALGDGHPAVRVAVASALGTLGDSAAAPALSRRLAVESSASAKAQLQSTLEQLRRGSQGAEGQAGAAPAVRYLVRLGAMRNPSGVRGEDLRRVLHEAAVSRAHGLKGCSVIGADPAELAQAAQRHLPIITLDGALTQLTESRVSGTVQVQARVEFAVRRDQTLKGTLSGAATTFASTPTLSEEGRRQLQNDAVDGAVQSALRGADQGLIVASL